MLDNLLDLKNKLLRLLFIEKSCLEDKLSWFLQKWIRPSYVWDLGWDFLCGSPCAISGSSKHQLLHLQENAVQLCLLWLCPTPSCGGSTARRATRASPCWNSVPWSLFRPSHYKCSFLPGWNSALFWTSLLYSAFSFPVMFIGSSFFLGHFPSVWSVAN